ncbi:MAG: CPBP family intramembrane metalloprotease [Sphaerochaetaceae bacterium]|nr:CPBP family intramembrane metalloprotease [Sphaerochaetaceae bacterium]
MKDDESSSALSDFTVYVMGFLIIMLLWSLAGPFVSLQALEVLQREHLASSTFHLYVTQHINFIILLFLEVLFVRFAARMSIREFISDAPHSFPTRFLFGGGIWLASMILYTVSQSLTVEDYLIRQSGGGGAHLIMILLALLFTPLQIFGEEILFRSFFYRAFSILKTNRHIVSVISAVAFSAAHLSNQEMRMTSSPVPIILYYLLSGFFFMEITYAYGGIAVAAGAHFINNFFISVIVNYQGSSIISFPYYFSPSQDIILDLIMLIVTSSVLLIIRSSGTNNNVHEVE